MSDRASATFGLPGAESVPLRCTACANRACEALAGVPGVARVDCDLAGSSVRVEFDPARVTEADLSVEMDRFGMELSDSVRHAAWRISGLD